MSTKVCVPPRLPAYSMPDVTRPIDRMTNAVRKAEIEPLYSGEYIRVRTAWQAILRGLKGKCPRCDTAKLFRSFLKPVEQCPVCRQDWSLQRADDFPAYVSILVTGHLMAPVIIALVQGPELPFWLLTALVVGMALLLMLLTQQPAKGAIIALQWWFEMHGFQRERVEEPSIGHDDGG